MRVRLEAKHQQHLKRIEQEHNQRLIELESELVRLRHSRYDVVATPSALTRAQTWLKQVGQDVEVCSPHTSERCTEESPPLLTTATVDGHGKRAQEQTDILVLKQAKERRASERPSTTTTTTSSSSSSSNATQSKVTESEMRVWQL
uniref:Uncharacterized protein n=1 Tax=Haptolina ericina TaxID=156174 RepID=A0A7S3EVA4_9EUKA|mmetsp:Transcript_23333/g.53014  ORF Transcript_23333/g.53014 Transcript_23333/m.53014 type:complete len:146 (+) Transcript_23333:459-896(+)